jgi:antitoxin VapB
MAYVPEGRSIPANPQSRQVRLFRNNRNQAVRIPVEFELPGDEAIMTRDGDRLIIEPLRKTMNLVALLASWEKEPPLGPDDDFPEVDDQPPEPKEIL